MNIHDRVYVAGHRGLVGSAIVRRLRAEGFEDLVLRTRDELDLRDPGAVRAFFEAERPDYVIVAAAKVGGILANSRYPVEFLRSNGAGPAFRNAVLRFGPGTYSMMRARLPSERRRVARSLTMLGCRSAAMRRASRSSRATAWGSFAALAERLLQAARNPEGTAATGRIAAEFAARELGTVAEARRVLEAAAAMGRS